MLPGFTIPAAIGDGELIRIRNLINEIKESHQLHTRL
jgi:hypothetical protein